MSNTEHPPSVDTTAFSCPHCNAYTTQHWHDALLVERPGNNVPDMWTRQSVANFIQKHKKEEGTDVPKEIENAIKEKARGKIIITERSNAWAWVAYNLWLARCYNCGRFSIWLHTKMIWPRKNSAPQPNPDMPEAVRKDFLEAGEIVQASPRGAAALLRLAIQKLCVELGEPGKALNDDIGALVKKGLNKRTQRALDFVRVIGNNAVHPGRIDLSDDAATANSLFGLINLVVDEMISQDARINEIYESLPPGAKEQIVRRDKSGE